MSDYELIKSKAIKFLGFQPKHLSITFTEHQCSVEHIFGRRRGAGYQFSTSPKGMSFAIDYWDGPVGPSDAPDFWNDPVEVDPDEEQDSLLHPAFRRQEPEVLDGEGGWTTKPPTKCGTYWARRDQMTWAVSVFTSWADPHRGLVIVNPVSFQEEPLRKFSHWIGPLSAPKWPHEDFIPRPVGLEALAKALALE